MHSDAGQTVQVGQIQYVWDSIEYIDFGVRTIIIYDFISMTDFSEKLVHGFQFKTACLAYCDAWLTSTVHNPSRSWKNLCQLYGPSFQILLCFLQFFVVFVFVQNCTVLIKVFTLQLILNFFSI